VPASSSETPAAPTSTQATPASSRPPAWVWVGLVALAGLAALYRGEDTQYWFHLAAGRSISESGLPARETWCLAAWHASPWLSQWLFEVALYQLHHLAGDWGVALWRAGWSAAAMALVARLLFVLGAAGWGAVGVALLAIAVARDRFEARPEQVSVVLLLAALVLLEAARKTGRDRTRWLIPVQVLWANVQGSWVFAPMVAWIYAGTSWLERRIRPRPTEEVAPSGAAPKVLLSPAERWGVLGVVLWAAAAVVPRPLETLARPGRFLGDMGVNPLTGFITELRPWSWAQDRAEPFTIWIGLWLVALLVGAQRMWKTSPGLTVIALSTFALGCLGAGLRAIAVWTGLAPLAIALAPRGAIPVRWGLAATSAGAGLLGLFWLIASPQFAFGFHPQLRSVPVRAAALADSLRLEGPVFNSFRQGGYLLWARGDHHPPLIDERGRSSLEFRDLYSRAHSEPVALDSLIRLFDFGYLLIEAPRSTDAPLVRELSRRLEWALVFYDDAGLLYVPWNRYPEIARARAYRYLSPDYFQMISLSERARADTGLATLVEGELRRACAESPYHARANIWQAFFAIARKDAKAAVAYLDEAERIDPTMPGLALRQGVAREMAGDRKGALEAYRRALRSEIEDDRVIAEGAINSLEEDR
jgi:tetratricopeptide (TPR) repeat protein